MILPPAAPSSPTTGSESSGFFSWKISETSVSGASRPASVEAPRKDRTPEPHHQSRLQQEKSSCPEEHTPATCPQRIRIPRIHGTATVHVPPPTRRTAIRITLRKAHSPTGIRSTSGSRCFRGLPVVISASIRTTDARRMTQNQAHRSFVQEVVHRPADENQQLVSEPDQIGDMHTNP